MESCLRPLSGRTASTSRGCCSFRAPASVARPVRVCVLKEDSNHEGLNAQASLSFPTTEKTGQDWRAFRAHLCAWESTARRAQAERRSLTAAARPTPQLQRPPYPPLVCGDSWAHPLPEPEQGCLLLARHDHMHFFTGAVILITSHDDAVGSVGYVLNKPSPLRVEELQVLGAASGFKDAFGSQRLHLGGPVHLDHVTLLHRFAGVGRAHKIAEGMYMGGLPDAIRLVSAGIARPSDFQLVLGMSGWAAGQLRDEIAAGYWHVISASPDLVLPTPSDPPAASPSGSPTSSMDAPPLQQPLSESGEVLTTLAEVEGVPAKAPGSSGRAVHSPMYRRIARLAVRGA
ncbi:hypothetical protein CHLRE_08g377950v5 [Chlamydomonas reinhardtii]|uniref:Transcriptional regulator n=1 Tax=Chlamydomonas reinhardtii TaxID=3055 RepID=A0A2K3DHU3_CHLRE|nr:uncharacterized protein CHLRE_08g377950v5 [Chlamydomonas reinhardtii]PNW80101.1 hypothetical protein CHLRE_08g377950v5 [Chlamydomonas reinhardtii]